MAPPTTVVPAPPPPDPRTTGPRVTARGPARPGATQPDPPSLPDPDPGAGRTPESEVYYAHCAAVRAAGKAPIRRGDPGYRPALDRDGDGQRVRPGLKVPRRRDERDVVATRHAVLVDLEQSAVIVPVPEAEPLVERLRAELDAAAGWGVPAHVTVLFPFVAPSAIDETVLAALGAAVGAVPRFAATFARVQWFGHDVVWLAPEPADPFVALTAAVHARFGLAPYAGVYGDEPVPHLTVGHDAPVDRMRAAAAEMAAGLPVHAAIGSVRLIVGRRAPNAWTTVAELPLGTGS